MDEDTLQTNINTLREMILDEEKLVTYVSLSKELCIHVNDSKFLLGNIIDDIKKKQPDLDLNVSYIISGLSEDNKARTTVTSASEIISLRKTFKIVFFEHIYSVSKGIPSVDNVAFLAINKFEDFPLCTGLIKNNFCIKRTLDEIGNLKSNSQQSVVTESKPVQLPQKKIKDTVKNGHEEPKIVTKVHESKSEPSIKKEIPSPKKDSSSSKQNSNKNNSNKTQKGIAGFFSKSNSAPSRNVKDTLDKKTEKPIKIEKETEKKKLEIEMEDMEVDEEVEIEKEIAKAEKTVKTEKEIAKAEKEIAKAEKTAKAEKEIPKAVKKTAKPEKKQETGKKENTKDKSKSKTVSQIKKNAKVDKKRKRVLHISDSESDDEKDPFADEPVPATNHESEDEIPPTPTVNTVKITSGLLNPKKKRKVVDKTYTDDDGYILTKKEVVYESCSDDEEVHAKENVAQQKVEVKQLEVKVKTSPKGNKNGVKNSKKKISPPQKGKQANIMNFFKKV